MRCSCPRCHREVDTRYYGPCGICRRELNATVEDRANTRALLVFLCSRSLTAIQ